MPVGARWMESRSSMSSARKRVPADLPQALANGRYAVEHAEIVAEFAAGVALVGLAHGAQPRAQQATAAAVGKFFFRADVIRAAMERLKIRDLAPQRLGARVRRGLDLRKHGQGDLLLARQERFILRRLAKNSIHIRASRLEIFIGCASRAQSAFFSV